MTMSPNSFRRRIASSGRILKILLFLVSLSEARKRKDGNPSARSIRVFNKSGSTIDIFWIHATTGQLADSHTGGDGVVYGGETGISSYVGHRFEVQEMPSKTTGKCREAECRKTYFTCNSNEEQWMTIEKDWTVTVEDHKSRALKKAKDALGGCSVEETAELSTEEQLDRLSACLEEKIKLQMQQTDDEIAFQASVRKQLGERLSSYTCGDEEHYERVRANITTTASIQNKTWTYYEQPGKQVDLNLWTLFESDHSRVQQVEHFLSPLQCQTLLAFADIEKLPLSARQDNEDVETIMHKIYLLISATLKEQRDYRAQDPLLKVQILGETSFEEQQCVVGQDGTCAQENTAPRRIEMITTTGDNVKSRLMILCQAPARGGTIYFPKAGVLIRPAEVIGDAFLIQHQVDGQREEDPFLDEIVICPVRQGAMATFEDSFLS